MPTITEHEARIKQNTRFLATIDRDAYPEWAFTVAFYIIVHYAEWLAALDGIHNDDHRQRKDYVWRHHKSVYRLYNDLFQASLDARYEPIHEFSAAYDVASLIDVDVQEFIDFAEEYLSNYKP